MISGKVTAAPLPCYSIPPPPHTLLGSETLYWWETIKSETYTTMKAFGILVGALHTE